MFRSREEAQTDFDSVSGLLYRIPADGWDDFNRSCQSIRHDFLPRDQATLVHTYMEKHARLLLAGQPGVYMPQAGSQGFYILCQNKWKFWLHKLNGDFSICNNTTAMSLGSLEQECAQLGWPGSPAPVTNLHLGYLLNATGTGMASVHIVCPNGSGNYYWEWTLLPDEGLGVMPLVLPVAPPAMPGSLVRPKPSDKPMERPAQDGSGS